MPKKRKLNFSSTAPASPAKRAGGQTGTLKAVGTLSAGKTVAFNPPEQPGELVTRLCQAGSRADELLGMVEGFQVCAESSYHIEEFCVRECTFRGLVNLLCNGVEPEPYAAAAAVGAQGGGVRQEQRHAAGPGVCQCKDCTVSFFVFSLSCAVLLDALLPITRRGY